MKFSERWLRTMVDPPLDTAGLCEQLTMAGHEVESSEAAAPSFSGVVVGRIDEVSPHPDTERLRVCTVDIGAPERLRIVCGAPNAAAGMLVPCATVGAQLPGGLRIAAATIRGVQSQGMLCSARELGIADDAAGLLELPAESRAGASLRDALQLDDTLIELKITPNRADCLSVLGIARDVAAITGSSLAPPASAPVSVASRAEHAVRVDEPVACPRFVSRVIEGIDARAPTPGWMKQRLERSGIRSISAVVDITNYVMLELGQPLHAYDDARLEGSVVVRFARPGEKLLLLNEQTLDLETDLLLVADEKKPLGLAGIMGGEYSGINDATTTLLLEGAYWNPTIIQGRSRRLGFTSDAGYRFERGVDFGGCARAVERATQLILDCCGGRAGPLSDVQGTLPRRHPVRVRTARVARLLGVAIPAETIATHLSRLDCMFTRAGDVFSVTPPSYRFDLSIEEDFVEEIARLHGYDAIPAIAAAHPQPMRPDREGLRPVTVLKRLLVGRGWQEAVTFSFVSSSWESKLFPARDAQGAPIRVENPIAAHLDVMRTTLAGGLIDVLRNNLARKHERIRVFETGRVYLRSERGYDQPQRLGGLAYGPVAPEQWGEKTRAVEFFDVKGDLEALVAPRSLTTERAEHPMLHPGRSARVVVEGIEAGWLGELHPRIVKEFELPRAPIVFEVGLGALTSRDLPAGKLVSRLPVVRRDMAVVVNESIPAEAVLSALAEVKPAHVDSIRLFDVYRGPGILTGKKSLAILVLMQDTERTLTDVEIDATMASLLRVIADRFGGTLRH
jgi:phenylalanyl-tRNA synthetase beta chain